MDSRLRSLFGDEANANNPEVLFRVCGDAHRLSLVRQNENQPVCIYRVLPELKGKKHPDLTG
jgi:hypothetical protein